jgi:CspA family cold shock protein
MAHFGMNDPSDNLNRPRDKNGLWEHLFTSFIIMPIKGVIKKLNNRGYGFIGAEGQPKDIFFHSKAVVNTQFDLLHEGESVTFEIEAGKLGPAASNVQLETTEAT